MPRPLLDSPFIFGIYEPGGEHYMVDAGRPGWIVFSEAVGHDPEDRSGVDYTAYSDKGFGIIVRLNHGYEPDGTLPHSSQYEQFARRVANFVATSRGCKIWVIGNEMNYAIERPGVKVDWSRHRSVRTGPAEDADPQRRGLAVRFTTLPDNSREIRTTRAAMVSPGEVLTPELYSRAYRLCREAIHRTAGHEDDLVLIGAVAPWNTQTIYPGNANGDWVQYFQDILTTLGPANCDGFAMHAYTHGADPALVSSPTKLAPPFQNRHQQFRTYTDFMLAVPANMRHLAVFLTEVGQTQPWEDVANGWVEAMYSEVDGWNRQPGNQQIRAACLYRWPKLDRWYIAGKTGVEMGFRGALANDFRWRGSEPTLVSDAEPAEQVVPEVAPTAPTPEVVAPVAAEPSGPRRRQRPPKTPPAYLIEWGSDIFPARLVAGQTTTATITVKNAGTLTWSWGGGNPVRLGYRYYRNRKLLPMSPAKDLRTDIPADVAPGETVTLEARVALPDEAGNYTLEVDLVQEGVSWFKDQGSPALTRWLTVEALSPEEQAAHSKTAVQLPVRLFTDISAQLPHSGAPYARRNLNQIKYIVVSHTAAHPQLSLDRIARAHIRRGYPGIAYDFIVDATGQILKVTELEDVAQPDQVWSEQGVNICLAGNFNQGPPPLPQLDAAGRLCAWLAQNLGMTADSIVGLGELIRSESPGETFYHGPTWKDVLTRQVRLHLAALGMGATDNSQLLALEGEIAELKAANAALRTQLADAAALDGQRMQEIDHLGAELADARRRLEAEPTVVEGGLRVHVLIDRLPRDARRYVSRAADDVEYIVVNHTGVAPETLLQQIAETHRAAWPGLVYDFVIDGKGEVFQTQPLDQVADTTEPYVRRAVNIAFAGDFSGGREPSANQLTAGGKLVTWLINQFPKLNLESVRGLNEFITTPSPGDQWNTGRAWKRTLLAATGPLQNASVIAAREREVSSRLTALERELETTQAERMALAEERADLAEEVIRLRAELEAKATVYASFVVPKPPLRVTVDQLPKHPTLRYERRALSQITHIAIHHTAAPPRVGPTRIAELHIAADPSRGKEAWPGIGYHFFVHEDGTIEQTNYLETASYHVFRHYGYAVGVVFAGSFMNGKIPSSAQLRAGAHLVSWLMQELRVPLARVWGHREFPDNMTVCPGGEWTQGNRWRDLLFERIEQIQQGTGIKTTRHYLLLWQRDGAAQSGREDLVNALAYIARFQPTAGFRPEEARSAEYVTIVGGEANVNATVEQMLIQAGCKVDRIAGRDAAETGRLLAELVRVGRRFRSFESDF